MIALVRLRSLIRPLRSRSVAVMLWSGAHPTITNANNTKSKVRNTTRVPE